MKQIIIVICLIFACFSAKELFINYASDQQSRQIYKYFHSATNELFVDIGAYDPIYASNTIELWGWRGINIEANQKRHRNFMIMRPNQINLNLAITNQSGGYATLKQYSQDSTVADPKIQPKLEKVSQLTMADLCHTYYVKKPKFMSIDIEGHGLIALGSNDWTNDKCIPDVLIVQKLIPEQKNKLQRQLLQANKYIFQKASGLNEYYIQSSVLNFYQQEQKKGELNLANMREQYWFPLFSSIFKVIAPTYQSQFQNFKHIDLVKSPVHVYFANYQKIISIDRIRKYSQFISGSTKPILIFHYNPLKSSIYFGSTRYTFQKVTVEKQSLLKYIINYQDQTITLYVLDHQVDSPITIDILDEKEKIQRQAEKEMCKKNPKIINRNKTVVVDNYLGN